MRFWNFSQGVFKPESEWEHPGKPEWGDALTVRLTQREAIRLLSSVAKQLECNPPGEDVFVDFIGEVKEVKE
jgi:hypothetical protein